MIPLFDENFLRAQSDADFRAFVDGPEAGALLDRLRAWNRRDLLHERACETACWVDSQARRHDTERWERRYASN